VAEIESVWQEGVGDCRQELVIIGMDMDREELDRGLRACLLTDHEMAEGDAAWTRLPDPFPAWDMLGAE